MSTPKRGTGPTNHIQPLPAVRQPLDGERRRAALAVCSMAADATEAATVLDMLGLLDADPAKVPVTAGEGRWN